MIELLGAVVFGTYFLKYFPTWQEAYLQGFFASVAATTNAGFDITGKSLIPFANDYFVLTLNIVLFIYWIPWISCFNGGKSVAQA